MSTPRPSKMNALYIPPNVRPPCRQANHAVVHRATDSAFAARLPAPLRSRRAPLPLLARAPPSTPSVPAPQPDPRQNSESNTTIAAQAPAVPSPAHSQSRYSAPASPNSSPPVQSRPQQRKKRHANPNVHTSAILEASRSGDVARLEEVVRTAERDGYELNAVNYTTIASGYVGCRLPNRVFSLLSVMRSKRIVPTPLTLRIVCAAAMLMPRGQSQPNVTLLLETLRWSVLAGTTPCTLTWNKVFKTMIYFDGLSEVIRLVFTSIATKRPAQKFVAFETSSRQKRTRWRADAEPRESDDLFWINSNIPSWDAYTFNHILCGLGKQGKIKDLIGTFGKILFLTALPLPQSSNEPVDAKRKGQAEFVDIITFNTVLDAVAGYRGTLRTTNGENLLATPYFLISLVDTIDRRGLRSDVQTETLLLRLATRCAAEARRRTGDSDKKATELQLITRFIHARVDSVLLSSADVVHKPDKRFFDAALTALGTLGAFGSLSRTFSLMLDVGLKPDLYTIKALLVGAKECGDISLANSLLDAAYALHIKPDPAVYTSAIAACARAVPPGIAHAEALLSQAADHGTPVNTAMINAAISAHGGNLQSAIALWKRIRATYATDPNVQAALANRMVYDSLFRVCGRDANPRQALRLFYAAKNSGHISPNSPASRSIFNAFLRGLDESGFSRQDLEEHIMKRNYLQILRTETGALVEPMDLPIERIRIRW